MSTPAYPLVPFWSLAELRNEKTSSRGEIVQLERIESATGKLIDDGELDAEDGLEDQTDEIAESSSEGKAFQAGDVLFGKLRPYLSKSWLADEEGAALGDIHVYRPSEGCDSRFLAYLVLSSGFVGLADASSSGTKMPRTEWPKIGQFKVPAPPLPTQRAIADYLDRETAEIDGMRADLDEMERLLEERRVSIIQRHVLPENGTYTRIKLVADVSLGKTVQKTQKDASEVLRNYVRAAHIQPHGRLVLDDQPMWFTPNELKQLTLEAGDVLVVEGGAGYGRSVYLREELPGWGFQNHVIRVRPWAGASGRFIDYTIRAHYGAGLIDILADGATIPGLSSDKARELPILNLSYTEQRRIADEIDRETAEIDSMVEDITRLRDLLVERRAAVISAAVTGQIDIPVSPTHKDEPHA
ncbi:restriction endonuclease subunit S [Corynebacterium striatum]|uniref:restriction endonuclease subunit S n=1 Tax=Corynebacterium striatum TaxID=43770 RepID=UPI001419275F|nr:restriction endonuclease subunit S [Corynebacterium striatum]HAT1132917.1 type I restriction endonuclease subunit S [Corynebacterium striatum]HAT1140659.1 type I restriction endonuclease subunit S [Corynebacterium striatum]HAT1143190.1 type I restriction endonuclease subunit S [Corynebacterium striatum]HAT1148278.1 type I restriction endonuclease subunit S [Corynebacterium striatum]HAT1150800.1 type I restriction endonuclease subunit S [Corynebacterium striatum]